MPHMNTLTTTEKDAISLKAKTRANDLDAALKALKRELTFADDSARVATLIGTSPAVRRAELGLCRRALIDALLAIEKAENALR